MKSTRKYAANSSRSCGTSTASSSSRSHFWSLPGSAATAPTTGTRPGSVAIYDQLAKDGSLGPTFQDLATLRAGYLLVDTAPFADLSKRLEPLTAADRPFRHSARALLALAAWKANDAAALKKWSDMIAADVETPNGTRGQIEMLNALTASSGKS